LVRLAGLEPARALAHHPLKMAWHLKFTHKTYKYSNYLDRLLAYLFIFHYIFI